MPRTIFGYSLARSEQIKDSLETDMALIVYGTRRLIQRVPDTGAIPARADSFLEEMRELADDLLDVVDQRTEVEP